MREVEPANELAKEFKGGGSTRVFTDVTSDAQTFSGALAPQRAIDTSDGTRVFTAESAYVLRTTPRQTVELEAIRMRMGELIGRLMDAAPWPIIDKTGLHGLYQFRIELPPRIAKRPDGQPVGEGPVADTIFKTIETLGLRLTESRAAMEIRVINKVERTPTEK